MLSRNKWVGGLAVVLALVWGHVAYRLFTGIDVSESESAPPSTAGVSLDLSFLGEKPLALDTSLRDPFSPYLYIKKPEPKIKRPVKTAPKKEVKPPTAILSGILWGDNPVAIFKQGGKSELLKEGGEAFGFKVQRIYQKKVVVVKEGKAFTLTQ